MRGVDDEAEEIDRREEEKKANIAMSRQKIAQLEAESQIMEADMEADMVEGWRWGIKELVDVFETALIRDVGSILSDTSSLYIFYCKPV